jgi:prevent-host-death family protein
MTMKPVRSIAASEFKATCLEVLDRVSRDGGAYVITKRGRPVAKVVPIDPPTTRTVRGSVSYLSDIVERIGDDWPVDE